MKLDKSAHPTLDVVEPDDQDKWAAYRAPQRPEDKAMSAAAIAWFETLPTFLRPHHLAERFPRICNRMAERQKFSDPMIPYFNDLLIDGRGERQGFPLNIAVEVVGLKEHYLNMIAEARVDVWGRSSSSRQF